MKFKSIICIVMAMLLCVQTSYVTGSVVAGETTSKSQIQDGINKEVEKNSAGELVKTIISGSGAITKKYVSTFGDTELQEGITELGEFSLAEGSCYTLKLPSSLRTIGNSALEGMDNLREITIPSGVNKIGNNVLLRCVNLQKIVNNSSASIEVPRSGIRDIVGYEFYVDGKHVSTVEPGKTALGKAREFKLNLVLNKGKIVGKTPKTYTYGENKILPKAKRKGYKFMGWSLKDKWSNGIMSLNPHNLYMAGDETRYAQFDVI
ncbi:leucine-rich repeat protein [Eubacterium xylanophilum]|uniref:leucine-rich repeat protein n=1 Tax=Eubacterium xylanophilum TaxID=39497 RepID=UPI00047B8D98|nr:leucine-rich repeat protein [Eubacterium xylanophilum]